METLPIEIPQGNLLPTMREADIVSLLQSAIENKTPIETIERLVALRAQLKAEYAEEQYDLSMNALQSNMPLVRKEKPVRDSNGKIVYYYAPIEAIVKQLGPLIAEHGFSYSIQTFTYENTAKAICRVKHRAGHGRESEMELPFIGQTKLMSSAHVVEGTLTLCQRKAFCNAFGIMTDREDDNGLFQPEKPMVSAEIVSQMEELIREKNLAMEMILRSNNVASLRELSLALGNDLLVKLQNTRSRKEKV